MENIKLSEEQKQELKNALTNYFIRNGAMNKQMSILVEDIIGEFDKVLQDKLEALIKPNL